MAAKRKKRSGGRKRATRKASDFDTVLGDVMDGKVSRVPAGPFRELAERRKRAFKRLDSSEAVRNITADPDFQESEALVRSAIAAHLSLPDMDDPRSPPPNLQQEALDKLKSPLL